MKKLLVPLMIILLINAGQASAPKHGGKKMIITSPAFHDQSSIPVKYSAFGDRLNPPLSFDNVPANAKSLALILEDLDAPRGVFDHWLLYNIPAADKGIGEGALPAHALAGKNTVGNTSYVPPQPPPGKAHRYLFTLYALDSVLPLKPGVRKAELEKAMLGHQLAKASLTGLFKR
jgi:Raf kinase inhibitor-like YbhB/YbcL family protein